MNKKGALEQLQALIVPLIAIGIVLVIGFLIMSEAKTQVVTKGNSTTYNNETVTSWLTGTTKALSNTDCMENALSCIRVTNWTGTGGAVDASIYSCSNYGITITNTTEAINATINVTYSCGHSTLAYNASSTVQNATQDIPGWLPIIIITIIGAILLGLVARFRKQ